jgi:serine protease inhibitor
MKQLLESIANKTSDNQLVIKLVNKLLLSNQFPLNSSFESIIREEYKTSVDSVDFVLNSKNVTRDLNEWVSLQTNNKIQRLFKDSLDSQSSLVFVNCVYFWGKWLLPFNPNNTAKGEFYNTDTISSSINMMTTERKFKVHDWTSFDSKLIELPFSQNISMIIVRF